MGGLCCCRPPHGDPAPASDCRKTNRAAGSLPCVKKPAGSLPLPSSCLAVCPHPQVLGCTHTCVHLYTHARPCSHVYMHAFTHTHMLTRAHMRAHTGICACSHTCAHTHYTRACSHIHTSAHTRYTHMLAQYMCAHTLLFKLFTGNSPR